MTRRRHSRAVALATPLVVLAASLFAQDSTVARRSGFVSIGSDAEDALRLAQLEGRSTAGWLLRSTSSLSDPLPHSGSTAARHLVPCDVVWRPVAPSTEVVWSSALPFARNDGPMWSGRGYSARLDGGVRAACGRVRVQVVPSIWYTQNEDFLIAPTVVAGRSSLASAFHSNSTASGDLPQRLGIESLLVIDPGQTSVEVDGGPLTVAASTESQWWGPGIRNALLLSNHAAGVPRVELRTRAPVATPAGQVEARWMAGALTESPYFDFDAANDLRSLSGFAVSLRAAFDTNLSVGGARVVYAPMPGLGALFARSFDVFARWGPGSNVRNATHGRGAEQLTELFARWVLPRSHAEIYGEWARVILPPSLRSLLIAPQTTQGYTVGMQWVSAPAASANRWRTQVEMTQLEQDPTSTTASFYVSPSVAQGYTQRGQVIGAAIGPGSNSQWIALDRLAQPWWLGAFAGRVRWDNDFYYHQPTSVNGFAHDVSVYAGLRGGRRVAFMDLSGEILAERRMNYLYQSACDGYCADDAFDVRNVSLRLTASPRF